MQYAEFDQSIRQQDAGAGFEVLGQGSEDRAHHGGGPGNLTRGDRQLLSGNQHDGLVIFQQAGANLGSLQVGKDADRLVFFLRHLPNHADQFGFLLMRAVRKIEARYVKSGPYQFPKYRGCAAGRAKRGDDFGAAGTIHATKSGGASIAIGQILHDFRCRVLSETCATAQQV